MKRNPQGLFLLLVLTWLGTISAQAQSTNNIQFPNPFKHVVVIFQENRTPDNLFQGLCSPPFGTAASCSTTPSATQYNIQTSNWLNKHSATGVTQPLPVPLGNTYDLSHAHNAFIKMYDGGKMDGAGDIPCSGTCLTQPQFRFVDNSTGTVNPYLELATQYGWANYMFQTNQGPSFPAHQFVFGGTSAPSASDDASGIFAAENMGGTKGPAGCIALAGTTVMLVTPSGENQKIYPCFEHQTMADLLDTAGVSWKYYAPGAGSIWTAPDAIKHICQPNAPTGGTCTGPDWTQNVDLKPADVLSDISGCSLRDVSWVIPIGQNSDHPGSPNTVGGPSWVTSIVNAIGTDTKCEQGKGYWSDTAIIISWDDWGGWYDHQKPTILTGNEGDYQYGFRVPLIVVSTYTPKGYINNVNPHDFGSILKFIQGVFNIREGALGFADFRANGDLQGFFNFSQTPRPFNKIAAPLGPSFFLNDKRPPEPPDND
ncbi:MAG TPA: alkaline phosphatase family protein [Terriglobales bacterium]|nr:alkaline phosphatase family protein [Terriglobales bacterium]